MMQVQVKLRSCLLDCAFYPILNRFYDVLYISMTFFYHYLLVKEKCEGAYLCFSSFRVYTLLHVVSSSLNLLENLKSL